MTERTADPAPSRGAGRTRARIRPWRLALAVLTVGAAAVGLLPDLLGLDQRGPFAQLVPFRPALLAGLLVLAATATVVALIRRRGWVLAGGLLAVAAVGAAMVLPRALPTPDVPEPDGPPESTLTVLAVNTYEGDADVAAVAELIRSGRPDLVALIEAGGRYNDRLAPLVEPLGYRFASSQERGRDVQGITAIMRVDVGDVTVQVDRSTPFPSVEVSGGALGALRFVAFHAVAPKPGDTPQWQSDLATLNRWCKDGTGPAIVAGDFNATLDHSVFRAAIRGCADAAERTGDGLVATWPSRFPRWLGPQIDHVLFTGGIAAQTVSIHDVPGSDHRAVLTRLRLPS
jgi:endonuclease/exonuclease/phosphatase (EEP) superfamily protein YafD